MYIHSELTKNIIENAFKVHNKLGFGFLEKVYHSALEIELKKNGFAVETEKQIDVYYDGQIVGQFFADLIVDGSVILEIKAVSTLNSAHETQLVNYLKATKIKVGLLLNFGKSLEIKRKIF